MELRQLEYFCTVGDYKNFTRAAQILHVSQPSVTKAIKALESELQLILVDRSQKHIKLTEEGQIFLKHARKILEDVENANQDMQHFKSQKDGIIRFGLPPMVEAYLFPNFFMKFQAAYPEISLDIQECGDSGEVRQKLENSLLDFGIIFTNADETFVHSMFLLNDEFCLCLPKNHKLAACADLTFKDLKNEKFILQQVGTYQHQKIFELCAESNYKPDVLLCTSQLNTIKQLVINGAGISFLPNFAIQSHGDFCSKTISPPLEFKIALAWNNNKTLSPSDNRFVSFVKTAFVSRD